MRFSFDYCVPLPIAGMVRAIDGANHDIVHQSEDARFPEGTPDEAWIKTLGHDGDPLWIVISGDGRILRKKAERQALDEAGLFFFCLEKPWPNTPLYEYAWKFMKVWPRIVETAGAKKGRLFKVSAGAALRIEPV